MNKNQLRRIIIPLVIVAIAVSTVIGIILLIPRSSSDSNSAEASDEIHLQMSWWGNDGRHMYTMKGVDLFQAQNPGIDVAYRYGEWNGYEKRNKVWMESHTAADVMQINYAWLNQYSPDGTGFYDLNELSDVIDLSHFTDEEKSYGTVNGKLNALPIAMNTHTFYYNQDILDEYGLSIPETWDDLFAMSDVLAPAGKYVLWLTKKHVFLLMIAYYEQSTGKTFFLQDGTLAVDEEGIRFILSFYRSLIDRHVICPIDAFDRSKYMAGEIAGTMCWISDTKIYCDGLAETGVKVSRGSYPTLEGATRSGWYVKPATMWAISADTEHPKESAMLLNYLMNDPDMAKLQKTEKGVPVSDAAVASLKEIGLSDTNEYKATQEMNEHQSELSLIIPNMEKEAVIDAFKAGADEYLYDKASLEVAAKATLQDMKDALK